MNSLENTATSSSSQLDGFLREWDVIGCKRRGIKPLIPISHASWWAGIANGRYPSPVKLSERVTAWRATDIRTLIQSFA